MAKIDYVGDALRRAGMSPAAPQMNASNTLHEPPRPLMRELPPADPFPVDALGPVLAPAARAIHDRVQAPMAICGQSVLAAATLAVQAYADVELPIGGKRTKPLPGYFVTIAETGERKTEADFHATWAIRKHEKNLLEKLMCKQHRMRTTRSHGTRPAKRPSKRRKVIVLPPSLPWINLVQHLQRHRRRCSPPRSRHSRGW